MPVYVSYFSSIALDHNGSSLCPSDYHHIPTRFVLCLTVMFAADVIIYEYMY